MLCQENLSFIASPFSVGRPGLRHFLPRRARRPPQGADGSESGLARFPGSTFEIDNCPKAQARGLGLRPAWPSQLRPGSPSLSNCQTVTSQVALFMLTWNELKPSMDLPKTRRFGLRFHRPPFCALRSFLCSPAQSILGPCPSPSTEAWSNSLRRPACRWQDGIVF